MSDTSPASRDCWSRIGVDGDHSCPELPKWSVCGNCPVFIDHGRTLFETAPPPGYLAQWSEVLAQEPVTRRTTIESLVVFRVHGECLGLRTSTFLGVDEYRCPRRVPHRSNEIFLGLVAVEGRIHLCVDLGALLGIPRRDADTPPSTAAKLLIIECAGQSMAFPVAEVLGVFRFDESASHAAPSTLQKAVPSFTTRIFQHQNQPVGALDAEALLNHLHRSVLA